MSSIELLYTRNKCNPISPPLKQIKAQKRQPLPLSSTKNHCLLPALQLVVVDRDNPVIPNLRLWKQRTLPSLHTLQNSQYIEMTQVQTTQIYLHISSTIKSEHKAAHYNHLLATQFSLAPKWEAEALFTELCMIVKGKGNKPQIL